MAEVRVPVLLAGHTLRSLRDSGYSLAAALGEVVDNALEANANTVDVRLDESVNDRGEHHVHRIAVADDGDGMAPALLHRYPQLGYSTRYLSTTTIGKYGVGAKLAALNFGTRIDVWSRADADAPWLHVALDLDEALATEAGGGECLIAAPAPTPVPESLRDLLAPGAGALVVWSKVDRLEAGRFAADADALRTEVEHELARMFRYFLDGGITIRVDGNALVPHDPLMLMRRSWADRVLRHHYESPDVEPAFPPRDHYGAQLLADEQLRFQGEPLRFRLSVYPPEVVRTRGRGDDELARALRLADNLGALSLVRLDREINYAPLARIPPLGVSETDRFIGIEVTFPPTLDESMGVRNVKRGVEPHGELRALLRRELKRWVPVARERIQEQWGEARRRSGRRHGEHFAVVEAAAAVDRLLPKRRGGGPGAELEAEIRRQLSRDIGHDDEATAAAYLASIERLPFVLETVDLPGDELVDLRVLSQQVVIRLNERHRFYQEVWQPLRDVATAPPGSVTPAQASASARRAVEALTLLVLAYAKAESLATDPDAHAGLRRAWGDILDTFLEHVRDVL